MRGNFMLEIRLATRLILRRPFMAGDSLLAGLLYRRYQGSDQGVEAPHQRAIREMREIITHKHNVPQMSVMLPYSLASRSVEYQVFIRSIMRDMEHDRDLSTILDKMPSKSELTPTEGPLGSIRSVYPTYDVPKVYFMGHGDIEMVERIAKDADFLGPQRARGLGQVEGVSIREVETDNPWFGMIGARRGHNIVLRPIPLRLRELFPDRLNYLTEDTTWHCPYFPELPDAVEEPCMVPSFQTGESFYDYQIESELSLLVQ